MEIATDRFHLSRKRERYEEFARADSTQGHQA
jgi:hypothetical protein